MIGCRRGECGEFGIGRVGSKPRRLAFRSHSSLVPRCGVPAAIAHATEAVSDRYLFKRLDLSILQCCVFSRMFSICKLT